MPEVAVKERTRKPKARKSDVIIACIEERLLMDFGEAGPHANRILELIDELKRSLNGKREEEEA